ncbi:MAG: long-chain fatty acid--CoA ligase [Candidatus Aminicenantes bacterium]|nr:long-chain fatty acid--CoA ligase [Candidatus Aminicenantes bacterium]
MVETIGQLFLNTIASYPKPDILLYKDKGRYTPISSDEFGRRVRHFALGLKSLGCKPGDKVVILSENCPEWVIADFANLSLGAVTVPIYPTLVPQQVRYITSDSDAAFVICSSPELWKKVDEIKKDLPKVAHFISFQPEASPGVLSLPALMEKGRQFDQDNPGAYEKSVQSVKSSDLASIIYTSGTTGVPKGVMLTHANFISNVTTLVSIVQFGHPDYVLSFLPLSHVLERMVHFAFLSKGCSMAYAESVETVADNLLEVRPHIMVSVPRLFEKLYAKVMDAVLAGSGLKKKIFYWAIKIGNDYGKKTLQKQKIGRFLRFKRGLAHKLVFSKILEKTGGRVRFFVSGGAPLSKDIADFFYTLGLVVLEGYGLTETAPVIAVNTFEQLKFGTVGKPIPGVEVKIAPDGEILVKGPNVMKGYYKKEAETREAFEGGWFHTGDIGHLDDDGYLVITDRKKDLIITAGGKNVAPQPIENVLKRNPYIVNAVVIGGRRKFISAIIVPNLEKLEVYAKQNGVAYIDARELVAKEAIQQFLLDEIDRATPHLAPYEKIRKILVLDRDFAVELEEMTPTLKVRRNLVEEKFKDLIDSLYRE